MLDTKWRRNITTLLYSILFYSISGSISNINEKYSAAMLGRRTVNQVHKYTRTCIHRHVHIYIHTHTNTHTWVYTYIHAHIIQTHTHTFQSIGLSAFLFFLYSLLPHFHIIQILITEFTIIFLKFRVSNCLLIL